MSRAAAAWVTCIGTLAALDVVLDRRNDGTTLSECTRALYRTDTRIGRCAFIASWFALATWYPRHILKPAA
jgi:hypothetical protein